MQESARSILAKSWRWDGSVGARNSSGGNVDVATADKFARCCDQVGR